MSTIYVMIPVALALASGAIVAFIWAVRSGQYDDPQNEAYRMLFEDQPRKPSNRQKP